MRHNMSGGEGGRADAARDREDRRAVARERAEREAARRMVSLERQGRRAFKVLFGGHEPGDSFARW